MIEPPPAALFELKLAHLRTFLEIARSRSFTQAASACRITQPSISQRIRRLESIVGGQVFDRTGTKVSLTPTGEILALHAERLFDEFESLHHALSRQSKDVSGIVRIGATDIASSYLLPPVLADLRRDFPGIEVRIVANPPDGVEKLLAQEKIDIAIAPMPRTRGRSPYRIAHSIADPLVAVLPLGHRFIRATTLTAKKLAGEPFIAYLGEKEEIETWFRRHRTMPAVKMKSADVEAVKRFIEGGLGISILCLKSVEGDVATGKLAAIPLKPFADRTLKIAHRRDRALVPAVRIVLDAFKARFA